MDPAAVIRVLVVDDHPIVRQGLRSYLSRREGIEVVGDAGDGESAVALTADLRPDVVLMDLAMPGMGGLAAIREVVALELGARILVLTSFSSEDQVLPAIQAGAAGYLLKDASPEEVESAIRAVHAGEGRLDPSLAAVVMAAAAGRTRTDEDEGLARLTPRETEVLRLLGQGLSNRALAERLFVSEKTVKTHVSSILAKLELADRTQAALFAVHHGLVED
ncbi:MAG: two-component system, NarL family, response regulator LiaR [Actinomycetota bacterium]|nr:two-component system, NarL family, response regulator LiaR [Actinomycetota bacterium]